MTRMSCISARLTAAVLAIALCSAPAWANPVIDPIFTFGFTELDGDYTRSGASGQFTAVAASRASGGPFDTAGDVTRVLAPSGTAGYTAGFYTPAGAADVQFQMNITDITANSASGNGTFTITDANGDVIFGNIVGTWARLGGQFGNFQGLAMDVRMNNTSGDGTFDGPSQGSFSMDFATSVFNGAIIFLETGSWFTQSFRDTATQVEASLIPAPGAAILGVLGFGFLSRLRRKIS